MNCSDKNELKMFRHEFTQSMKALEEKFGVKVDLGRISYSDTNFSGKITVSNVAEDGTVENPEAEGFRSCASLVGLKPEDLGREFTHRGETYKITGLNLRRSKYPISAECNGKGYKFPKELIHRLLKIEG